MTWHVYRGQSTNVGCCFFTFHLLVSGSLTHCSTWQVIWPQSFQDSLSVFYLTIGVCGLQKLSWLYVASGGLTQVFRLARQVLYLLSHLFSPVMVSLWVLLSREDTSIKFNVIEVIITKKSQQQLVAAMATPPTVKRQRAMDECKYAAAQLFSPHTQSGITNQGMVSRTVGKASHYN